MKNLSEMPSEPIGEVVASGIDERGIRVELRDHSRNSKPAMPEGGSEDEDILMQGHEAGVHVNYQIRQKEKRGGVFNKLLDRLRNRKQKAPAFPDHEQVFYDDSAINLAPFMVREENISSTENTTPQGDVSVNEVNKPQEPETQEAEDSQEPQAEREKTPVEEALSRLNDKLESITVKGMLQAGTEALKASLSKVSKKLVPETVKDFFEARDVKKHVESSAVFENRESAIRRSVELTHAITEKSVSIANIDSLIAREKAAMSDAEKEKTLRMQLAEGDDQLIQEAQETFDALYQQIQEKIADLESQKIPLVAERDMLMSQKEAAKAVIRADNKRLETLVEGRVENLKAKVGFEEITERRDALKEQLKSERVALSKLDAKIGAYNATIDRGGYSKEKVTDLKAKLKELKAEAKKLRASLDKTEGKYNKIDATTTTLETRFKAMSGVLPKMGVITESQLQDENKVVSTQTTSQGITASVQTQPQVQQPAPTASSESMVTNYEQENLPEEVEEVLPASEKNQPESKEDPRIKSLKEQFNQRLGGIKNTQKKRPNAQDVNAFVRITKDFWAIKTDKTNELSPLVQQLQAMKNNESKRAEKIALLKQIQSKLN